MRLEGVRLWMIGGSEDELFPLAVIVPPKDLAVGTLIEQVAARRSDWSSLKI